MNTEGISSSPEPVKPASGLSSRMTGDEGAEWMDGQTHKREKQYSIWPGFISLPSSLI